MKVIALALTAALLGAGVPVRAISATSFQNSLKAPQAILKNRGGPLPDLPSLPPTHWPPTQAIRCSRQAAVP